MRPESSLPSYQQLFGDLDFTADDGARTVYSPAAYLADLMQLLGDPETAGDPHTADLTGRRPDLPGIALDAANIYTELPYLDIVNEVLAREIARAGGDTAENVLSTLRHPFNVPYSVRHERLRRYLHHLGVDPVELYRRFATTVNADVIAREYLGLTPVDVTLLTTVLGDSDDLRDCFRLDRDADEPFRDLEEVERFLHTTSMTGVELRELLYGDLSAAGSQPERGEATRFFVHHGGEAVVLSDDERYLVCGHYKDHVPIEWFDRANRFVRLARKLDLSFTDLDLVLRTCCGNRIDLAALRTLAVVTHLRTALDLPVDVVVSLVAPMNTLGVGDRDAPLDLFNRVFNAPFTARDRTVLRANGYPHAAHADLPALTTAGDVLGPANAGWRRRVAAALGTDEGSIAAIVDRYRDRPSHGDFGPFDHGADGFAALSLLHRVTRLAAALDIPVPELLDTLDALERDPTIQRFHALPVLVDTGISTTDYYAVLAEGSVSDGLWLVQTLVELVRWMGPADLTGTELRDIIGSREAAGEGLADRLREQLDLVGLTPALFESERFGERAAQVIHDMLRSSGDGVTSPVDNRQLRVDPLGAASAAYAAIAELSLVATDDFRDVGLDERFSTKLLTNLVLAGYLGETGEVLADRLPGSPRELRLSSTFSGYARSVFDLIASCCGDDPEEPASIYPSDLETLETVEAGDLAELYDNLVFNGYLDADGVILRPDFFTAPENAGAFVVDADLGDITEPVLAMLREKAAQFSTEPIGLDPTIFAALGLTDAQLTALLDSLTFNGYVSVDGDYLDPAALLALSPREVNLAIEFYPLRGRVLDAVHAQLHQARSALLAVTTDDVRELVDTMVAERVMDHLDGVHLRDGRLTEAAVALVNDPEWMITVEGFTDAECATIAYQLATIVSDGAPYRFDLAAVSELGFSDDERDQLVAGLVEAGHLTPDLTVSQDRLAYFGYVHHALDYRLPGLSDFSRDIFFLLHAPATATSASIATIADLVTYRAAEQHAALFAVLQEEFEVPAPTIEAICAAVVGTATAAVEMFISTEDPDVRRAVRRIRGFARLAAKLNLSATEVTAAFHDQDLTGKFPEPIALPPGVDRIDALLERLDGTVHLFRERRYWTYAAATHELVAPEPKELTELSSRFTDLVGVDAAFVDGLGIEWIVGRDTAGTSHSFTREPGRTQFLPKQQTWGTVKSAFDDPARIDAAFVDEEGRTYLFCGDQYVRYSGSGFEHVDEGYPRKIGEWWEGDGHQGLVPPRFRASLDAAFRGLDGRTHLFAGDRVLSVGGENGDVVERPLVEAFGRVANALAGAKGIDAAYTSGPALYVFAGNQVFRYSDSIENDGVRVDEGFPKRIESFLDTAPVEFEGGVEAAFVDLNGVTHLFKDGRTVALRPDSGPSASATAARWGLLGPVLPSGTVDAAMVGLDGRTYVFSGDQYLRYSSADYAVTDVGYPRTIAGDWGGLTQVDASFVMDGGTYLFGTGGPLFTLPLTLSPDHAADLEAGKLPRSLRQKLADHAVAVAADVTVSETASGWQLAADRGLVVVLRRTTDRIEVSLAGSGSEGTEGSAGSPVPSYVRYSTRDYTTPDAGYPRPMTDNWWNLPEELVDAFGRVDAVFTGRDGRTYLFAEGQFVVFDNKRRWWSQPRPVKDLWGSLPFEEVDAAFVGTDDKTYVFSGPRYVRYSNGTYTRLDDRYPAMISPFWGNVVNTITRTGRVDAALVVDNFTYLFSGNQFVRYTGTAYTTIDDGYPRRLSSLAQEPRFAGLTATLTSVDAAFTDRGTIYLVSGRQIHAVSASAHRRYDAVARDAVGCAFLDSGGVRIEHADGWHHYSALEGATIDAPLDRPRALRAVPEDFRTGLDAVLQAPDGNTYLFKGTSCFNTRLGRDYPLAEEWGRPRNNVYHDNRVDAAFVGTDGKTYVFSGDQFVVYSGLDLVDATVESGPRSVAEHWGGLTGVALAYVRDGVTYLFESGGERYVRYSGKEYTSPDSGYPREAGPDFWEIPDRYRPAGFTMPDAVLFTGDTMLVVTGGTFLQHTESSDTWSYARPLERIWRGIGSVDELRTAFTGRDGATYFFFTDEFTRYAAREFAPRRPIRDHWARTRNNFLASSGDDIVDAAVVVAGRTYLFSGDQYVRYSSDDCRFVDAEYPKPIVGNLRTEEGFTNLPVAFDEEVAQRFANGSASMVDAAVTGGRTVYLFVDRACHAVSSAATATYDVDILGRVRNNIADRQRVDAALVHGQHTYLFSGDQFVRYTGPEYALVDDGYPRALSEFGLAPLPEGFRDGIDAALRVPSGPTYLFAGRRWLKIDGGTVTDGPVAGGWGVVHNEFRTAPLDAAFVTTEGELFAFCKGQFVRYSPDVRDVVDEGYPHRIRDSWGNLPSTFEDGIDGAFRLHGRVYLTLGNEFVRYAGDRFDTIDRTGPTLFRHRFADAADYRIDDVRAIQRFVALARREGLDAGFLLPGPGAVTDPYQHVAGVFGWNLDELKWCRRHSRFLSDGSADEERFELEFLLELVDLFALADRFGTGPSKVSANVWAPLHPYQNLDAANTALRDLVERRAGADWPILARQLHDELNLALRAVLVPAVVHQAGLTTSRDLYDHFLIDVDMGSRGMTSRVREAIAATQLYIHRLLLNLEDGGAPLAKVEALREKIKSWWTWMRNYRVWEANRKVFLYPENYIRPELRIDKTPAFTTLESDLLQGEITAGAVEKAYKKYLDEYTEVSRLTIAGGYVYSKDQEPAGARRLVLFGRTKTDPRRYFYRRAEFTSRDKLSAHWEPWLPVNVQIDADTVHPVHAFGRVFVFWAMKQVVSDDDPATTKVVTKTEGDTQTVSAHARTERVKICYSFYNLNKEWVPAQALGLGPKEEGTISDLKLLVRPRMRDNGKMSIIVSCTYAVTPVDGGEARPAAVLFDLNPELYADNLLDPAEPDPEAASLALANQLEATVDAATTADRVSRIFMDEVRPTDVVRFDAPAGAEKWPWFSVDIKGGSFLCRPVVVSQPENAPWKPLAGNADGLPEWSRVDAAFEVPKSRDRYFFDNGAQRFARAVRNADGTYTLGEPEPTGSRWGLVRTVLPVADTAIDSILTRGRYTFVFYGDKYVRFTDTPFGLIDDGYPRTIGSFAEDELPAFTKIDVAFTDRDGVEYFYNYATDSIATSTDLTKPFPITSHREEIGLPAELGQIITVMATETATFMIVPGAYVKFSHAKVKSKAKSAKEWWESQDGIYAIAGNTDGLPENVTINEAVYRDGTFYYFDNTAKTYLTIAPDGTRTTRKIHVATSDMAKGRMVDAAWTVGDHLYLTHKQQFHRYTIVDGKIDQFSDDGYPQKLPRAVTAAFRRDDQVYLFSGQKYVRIPATQEPTTLPASLVVSDAWAEMPKPTGTPFDAALDSDAGLFLFLRNGNGVAGYHRHAKTISVRRPYELSSLPFEIVRLTTGTASELNRKLLAGGVPALLDLTTQETDEVLVSTDADADNAVRVYGSMVDTGRLPSGSHLDFRSANGIYYWEIFFHAPQLIAQALNNAQRFEDAKRWYEYVFDPTNLRSHWRFLPFLTVDPLALADTLTDAVADARAAGLAVDIDDGVAARVATVTIALRDLAPAILANRDPAGDIEESALSTLVSAETHGNVADAIEAVSPEEPTPAQRDAIAGLIERTLMAADLEKVLDALGDHEQLLKAYRDNPFDPHAIAGLRPTAYRRAVVMGYIDNLLDWGDLLFRQYTPESVDEARMLYVYAYDLLGAKPEQLGTRLLPRAGTVDAVDDQDLLGYFTSGGTMVEGGGAVHAGVTNSYFSIPENSVFADYWTRVEDRLHKIRESLNILGIAQPLPLFAPPIDPMALVRATAAGLGLDSVLADLTVAPPHYKFGTMLRKAQELADKVNQFGNELLSVLERGSAEELALLQNRQEKAIQAMTVGIKEAQVRMAEETVAELTRSAEGAAERAAHYQKLIASGMNAKEQAQIGLTATGAGMMFASSVLKVASGIVYLLPQGKVGPFIIGFENGGRHLGASLDKASEVFETMGDGFSMVGEVLGIQAQHERMTEDWTLQLATAKNDGEQIVHRLAGATEQVAIARREADILAQEIEHKQQLATFMTDKFPNAELYSWMAGRLSGLYFQLYGIAYETAKAAERAYQFENGTTATFIQPVYWETRRNGLLAGASLGLDLERLAKAHLDGDARGLEITKQISLLDLDPVAMLRLRQTGSCEFALSEALFDEDFAGHYRRQVRTVTVTFVNPDNEPIGLNGTLTQLSNRTVLEADPKAVKHLLDPRGALPTTVRTDWRPSQQIALSQPDGGRDNNGLFELRFDDERYLPFEGTGAVSTWRLERSPQFAADLYDVFVTVKYSAENGGEVFANAVKGMLKPRQAARFFDVAREFPDEWADFQNGNNQLVLPLTPDMFPGMAGHQIGGIIPAYELTNGSPAQLVLGGDPKLTLEPAKLLPTPGFAVREDSSNWVFTVDGDKEHLGNVGLVLTYQARMQ